MSKDSKAKERKEGDTKMHEAIEKPKQSHMPELQKLMKKVYRD